MFHENWLSLILNFGFTTVISVSTPPTRGWGCDEKMKGETLVVWSFLLA